jgi:hypothetical protein
MAFPPTSYGSGGGGYNTRGPSADSASVSLALDNMIRNQLKVSDPRNPKQVADALLNYYQNLPQAASIAQEAQGLPFLLAPQRSPQLLPPSATSSDREFSIAQNDVERALNDLSTSALTNDIIPEMQGWALTIRAAVADGSEAARQGLDPRMRDRVMATRRQLGEYARLARFVGSLYPGMGQNFRRLGQALDEVSAVLLVMLGEALSNVGFASGNFLLQVPLSELQARRDAVIYALRNFMGGAQQSYGPDDWPRGISAYRLLFNRLEQQGQGDLRTLLTENEIARVMDELISRAQNGSAEGLRGLGATAQLDIERFRRLAIVGPGAMGRENSPPLSAYLEALMLFADAFTSAGGLRLLRIARPPILFYGLYNSSFGDTDRSLLDVIAARGRLATLLDSSFLGSQDIALVSQVLFDMLSSALDRIIDLLAMGDGNDDDDLAKQERAFAYWLVIRAILSVFGQPAVNPFPSGNGIQDQIRLEFHDGQNQTAVDLVNEFNLINLPANQLGGNLISALAQVGGLIPNMPVARPHLRTRLIEELQIQKSLEKRWRELVRSVAPEAAGQDLVFSWLQVVVMQAISAVPPPPQLPVVVAGGVRPPHVITWEEDEIREGRFPPQYEQSLEVIARRV